MLTSIRVCVFSERPGFIALDCGFVSRIISHALKSRSASVLQVWLHGVVSALVHAHIVELLLLWTKVRLPRSAACCLVLNPPVLQIEERDQEDKEPAAAESERFVLVLRFAKLSPAYFRQFRVLLNRYSLSIADFRIVLQISRLMMGTSLLMHTFTASVVLCFACGWFDQPWSW